MRGGGSVWWVAGEDEAGGGGVGDEKQLREVCAVTVHYIKKEFVRPSGEHLMISQENKA